MSIVLTILFVILAVWGYSAAWPMWLVIALAVAAAICLFYVLARLGAFGRFIADVLDELVPSDYDGFDPAPDGDDFDIFDFD